jgi:hypothetical protein
VLFNIAAISSQIAEVQNRTTPEGLKKASHFFQLSAGTFEQVRLCSNSLLRCLLASKVLAWPVHHAPWLISFCPSLRLGHQQLRSYLEEHPQQAVPIDFSTDYLNMAINLMLAQAQECFCEKVAHHLCTIRFRLTDWLALTRLRD